MPIATISPQNNTQVNSLQQSLSQTGSSLMSALNSAIQKSRDDTQIRFNQEQNFINEQQKNIANDRAERFDLRDRTEFALEFGETVRQNEVKSGQFDKEFQLKKNKFTLDAIETDHDIEMDRNVDSRAKETHKAKLSRDKAKDAEAALERSKNAEIDQEKESAITELYNTNGEDLRTWPVEDIEQVATLTTDPVVKAKAKSVLRARGRESIASGEAQKKAEENQKAQKKAVADLENQYTNLKVAQAKSDSPERFESTLEDMLARIKQAKAEIPLSEKAKAVNSIFEQAAEAANTPPTPKTEEVAETPPVEPKKGKDGGTSLEAENLGEYEAGADYNAASADDRAIVTKVLGSKVPVKRKDRNTSYRGSAADNDNVEEALPVSERNSAFHTEAKTYVAGLLPDLTKKDIEIIENKPESSRTEEEKEILAAVARKREQFNRIAKSKDELNTLEKSNETQNRLDKLRSAGK